MPSLVISLQRISGLFIEFKSSKNQKQNTKHKMLAARQLAAVFVSSVSMDSEIFYHSQIISAPEIKLTYTFNFLLLNNFTILN